MKNFSFNINEFRIPSFNLHKGEMIRFWVQIIPKLDKETDGYWGAEQMKKAITEFKNDGEPIKICAKKIKRTIKDYIFPQTVGNYLEQKFGFSEKQTQKLISRFDIKSEYKIKDLGTGHQKVLSIICEFQRSEYVLFDYFGLDPSKENQLTQYVKSELKKGKAAIGFDNLYYKPKDPDTEMINNIEIIRTKGKTN